MEDRFEVGVFLGLNLTDLTYRIGVEGGDVVAANSIKQLPDDEIWNFDRVKDVKGVPWNS